MLSWIAFGSQKERGDKIKKTWRTKEKGWETKRRRTKTKGYS